MAEELLTFEETIINFLGDYSYSKVSSTNIQFKEKNGVTGTVFMAYIYSTPFREHPEKKELIIKRIEVFGKGVVNSTLDKIWNLKILTHMKIESIQNKEWIPLLQERGWTIIHDDGGGVHAIKPEQKGGRKRSKKIKIKKSKIKKKSIRKL